MNNEIFRKSLIRTISMMADIDGDYCDEKEKRLRAMMQTYLIVTP